MVAGALLLLCAAPTAALAVAESMVTLTLGNQSPSGPFGEVAKSGTMAGLNGGYRVTRWLESGVDIAYFHELGQRDGKVLTGREPSTDEIVTLTLAESWTVTELGLYGKAYVFEHKSFSPYLRFGAGAYSVRYSVDVAAASGTTTAGGNEEQSKFGFSGGLGVRGRIFGDTSLGLEAVHHKIFAKDTDVSFTSIGVTLGFGSGGK
jgi:hypothetical protein